MERSVHLVGYRFHPTDEELINYYLMHKMLGNESYVEDAINEVDICKFDPWKLCLESKIRSDNYVWYFFWAPDYKYSNSRRLNRMTTAGYWKVTGKDREVKATDRSGKIIGTKKTLVFYEGRVPNGKRTNWIIHEYHASIIPPCQREYVICKLKVKEEKTISDLSCDGGEPSCPSMSSIENLAAISSIPEVNHPVQENWVPRVREPREGISFQISQNLNDFGHNHDALHSYIDFIQNDQEAFEDDEEFVNSLLVDPDEFNREETLCPLVRYHGKEVLILETSSRVSTINHWPQINCITRVLEGESFTSSESGEEYMVREESSHSSNICGEYVVGEESSDGDWEACESQSEPEASSPLAKLLLKLVAPQANLYIDEASTSANEAKEDAESDPEVDLSETIMISEKEWGGTQETTDESYSNSTPCPPTVSKRNEKGSFIFLERVETPKEQLPLHICFRNLLIGMLLFLLFARELVVGH